MNNGIKYKSTKIIILYDNNLIKGGNETKRETNAS